MPVFPQTNGVTTYLSPPEGYVVDFQHPQRRANIQTYWVAGIGNFLGLVLLGQRLYTKTVLSRGLQLDDAFVVLSWLFGVATQAILFADGDIGVHAWEIPIEKFNFYMITTWIASYIYVLCGSFAKLSLLVFFLRLSQVTWFKAATWAIMFFVAGYSVAIVFSLVFACTPVRRSFDVSIPEGSCISQVSLYYATAAFNILADILLFVIPMPLVLGLQMPRAQKLGVLVVFIVASATVITSIVRCVILPEMFISRDLTWVISYASMWIIIEANLQVICATLTTLRKFSRHVAPRLLGEGVSRTGKTAKTAQVEGRTTNTLHPARDQYVKFSDDIEMFPGREASKAPEENEGGDQQVRAWAEASDTVDDDDSQKAIIHTTAISVKYT